MSDADETVLLGNLYASFAEAYVAASDAEIVDEAREPVQAHLVGQLSSGMELVGSRGAYEVLNQISAGRSRETYLARRTSATPDRAEGEKVIIKVPHIDRAEGMEHFYPALERIARFDTAAAIEYANLDRLRDLPCAAHMIDSGTYQSVLAGKDVSAPAVFSVQKFIDGLPLHSYFERHYSSGAGGFRGVPLASEFFYWARQLTIALRRIHQRQVVHGDIRPNNIRISPSREPVFIDFGQAVFREIGLDHEEGGGHDPFQPPEASRSAASDVYSLGAVFHFIATGCEPPYPHIKDIGELKRRVVDDIRRYNLALYRENCGIADVIARCLRHVRHGRIPHTDGVLQDLDNFSGVRAGLLEDDLQRYQQAIGTLEASGNSPFALLARANLQSLAGMIEQMAGGTLDVVGDHDQIVSTLCLLLSFLQKGDMYLTVSDPSFWEERNAGENGRFMSMNRLAAERGATIRRIFVLTEEQVTNQPEPIRTILSSHKEVMEDLEAGGQVSTTRSALDAGGFYTAYRIVNRFQREKLLRPGRHYGAVIKGQEALVMYPLYRENGLMVAVQCSARRNGAEMRREFERLLAEAKPLRDLEVRQLEEPAELRRRTVGTE